MVINGIDLLVHTPISQMLTEKHNEHGVSHGLGEAGYDIRIKQDVQFLPARYHYFSLDLVRPAMVSLDGEEPKPGNFTLASAIEEFRMPDHLMGIVHDKSSWARKGLAVHNTVIEPGWRGFLTLELVFNGPEPLIIPAGAGIAQVVFHQVSVPACYDGKYQDQADQPVEAIHA
jgi:dCTP deaminase